MRAPFALCLATLALLGGCGRSPAVTYYVLPTPPPGQAPATAGVAVIVGPVQVPRLVDRPQLVWRTTRNRIQHDDLHRWGASLASEIQRATAENLRRLLPSRDVVGYPAEDPGGEAFRIAIDIQDLDAVPPDGARLRARWIVRRGGEPDPIASEMSEVRAPLAGGDPHAVVEAYGEAVELLSREIAARLRALAVAGGP